MWQLLGAIIYFLASLVLFVFSLIFTLFGDCSCYQIDDNPANDWFMLSIDDGDLVDKPCEHTLQRGALCYTPCRDDEFNVVPKRCPVDTDKPGTSGGCRGFPRDPFPLCSAVGVIQAFFDVIKSFFGIFNGSGIQVPDPFPDAFARRRTQRDRFSEKVRSVTLNIPQTNEVNITYTTSTAEIVADAVWGYDMRGCIGNITQCVCDHFHTTDHMNMDCRNGTIITTQHVTHVMSEYYHKMMVKERGTDEMSSMTICDDVICSCDNTPWEDVPYSVRVEYVDCLERRVKGERLHEIVPGFPADYYYRVDGNAELMHTLIRGANDHLSDTRAYHVERERQARERYAQLPPRMKNRRANRKIYAKHLGKQAGIPENSFVMPYLLRLDRLEHDWRTGRLGNTFARAHKTIRNGDWHLSTWQHTKTLGHASLTLGQTIMSLPFKKFMDVTYDSVVKSVEFVREQVYADDGRSPIGRFMDTCRSIQKRHERDNPHLEVRREQFRTFWRMSPVYKWYYGTWGEPNHKDGKSYGMNPLGGIQPFIDHMSKVARHYRDNHKTAPWTLYNLDLKLANMKNNVVGGWETKWTSEKSANIDRMEVWSLRMIESLWPGSVTVKQKERFLFNSNCIVGDGVVEITGKVVNYCVSEFVDNLLMKREMENPDSPFYNSTMASRLMVANNADKFTQKKSVYYPKISEEEASLSPFKRARWNRPKIDSSATSSRQCRVPLRDLGLGKRQWRRLRLSSRQNSSGSFLNMFNLLDWFLCVVEDLFGSDFSMDIMEWIMDFQEWVSNPNTDPTMGDVGLLYWIQFWVVCDWPIMLNCSIGVGLEQALYDVAFWAFILFFLLAILLPGTMLPMIALGGVILLGAAVGAHGFRWSPRCALMLPSFFGGRLGSLDEDMQIPGISFFAWLSRGYSPIPIPFLTFAFPALPECLMDEIIALLDKYITTCYLFLQDTPIWWILPPYMVNGDICPMCPEKIDFQNCGEIGMGDGLTNLFYLLNMWFPNLCGTIIELGETCISSWFPGVYHLVADIFDRFKDVSDTQDERFTWCFWATLPSLAFVLVLGFLFFTFIAVAWLLFISLVSGLWSVFVTSPIFWCCGANPADEDESARLYAGDEDEEDDDYFEDEDSSLLDFEQGEEDEELQAIQSRIDELKHGRRNRGPKRGDVHRKRWYSTQGVGMRLTRWIDKNVFNHKED